MKQKPKPRGSLLAALDIGTHKIACFIGRIADDEGGVEVIGVGYHASQGVKGGAIIDIEAADNAIRQTVHTAENMAAESMKGYPLREVIVNVPGIQLDTYNVSANITISGQEITENDMKRALAKAQEQIISANYEMIHTIPVYYNIDGQEGIREPRGMTGQNLEVGIHIVTGDLSPLQNMASCVERSHLDVEALCAAPYASGLAC